MNLTVLASIKRAYFSSYALHLLFHQLPFTSMYLFRQIWIICIQFQNKFLFLKKFPLITHLLLPLSCVSANSQTLNASQRYGCEVRINDTLHKCERWEFDKTYYKSTQTEDVCFEIYSFWKCLGIYFVTIFHFSGVWFVTTLFSEPIFKQFFFLVLYSVR